MKLQKFEADTMPQALVKVKAAFGPDAVIMDTRSVRKSGAFGLGMRDCVQVWAARSFDDAPARVLSGSSGGNGGGASAVPHLDTGLLTALHARLGDIEAKLEMLSMAAAYGNGGWGRAATASVEDDAERRAALAEIARRIPVSGEISLDTARIVAVVGATGAGKTMTVAKLAGRFAVMHGARVGVICADGVRIGAMAEMGAYCDLLGVPMAQLQDMSDLSGALETHSDRDLILVDTAGGSQRNSRHLTELREVLQGIGVDETHLVLSAAASPEACAEAIERFSTAGATHLLFTKIDESPDPAPAIATALGSGRTVSYIAGGQAVPQDIWPADERCLVELMTANHDPVRVEAVPQRAGQ